MEIKSREQLREVVAGIILMNFPSIGVVPSESLLIGSGQALMSADDILSKLEPLLRIPDQTREDCSD